MMRPPAPRQLDDPAAGAAQFMIRLGLVVLAIGVPLAAVWSRRFPITLVPVGAAVMMAGALLAPDRRLLRPLQNGLLTPVGAAALVLVLWAGLSVVWSPLFGPAGERYFKTIATLALAAFAITVLPPRMRTSNLYLFPLGVGAAAIGAIITAIITGEWFSLTHDYEMVSLDRAALSLAALAWPAIGALAVRERWISSAVVAFAALAAVAVIGSDLALMGLGGGAIVFALAWMRPRATAVVLAVIVGLLILGAPALAILFDRLSPLTGELPFTDAAAAWAGVIERNPLRALTGHGFDSAARGFVTRYLPADAPRGAIFATWFDLGLIGALASAVLVVRAFLAAAHLPAPMGAFMIAGFATIVVIAVAGAVALQMWWLNFLCVVAVGYAVMMRGQYRTSRPPLNTVRDEKRPTI